MCCARATKLATRSASNTLTAALAAAGDSIKFSPTPPNSLNGMAWITCHNPVTRLHTRQCQSSGADGAFRARAECEAQKRAEDC